jgi:predicted  nucleic acid-binding Zn-ribbon protein
MISYILYFAAGIIITAIIAYLLHRSLVKNQMATLVERLQQQSSSQNQLQLQVLQLQKDKDLLLAQATKAEYLGESLAAQNIAYNKLQQEYQVVQNQFVAINENLKNAEEKLALQKEELNKIGESFKFEFRNLAQNIL